MTGISGNQGPQGPNRPDSNFGAMQGQNDASQIDGSAFKFNVAPGDNTLAGMNTQFVAGPSTEEASEATQAALNFIETNNTEQLKSMLSPSTLARLKNSGQMQNLDGDDLTFFKAHPDLVETDFLIREALS
ncbi:MAG: hypothetical protein KC462_00895 [Cyanobacteria bacterium HKST-UBA05]|nr:hypothetical protein [Cyanobacteria bacterium HKST-UBA05]